MNTRTFAQEARKILMNGVAKKLLYWGFSPEGEVVEAPIKVSGGYNFRGEVGDDPNVPDLWQALKNAIKKKGIDVVVEEAAYTWFNRLMALRIMAKNGYEPALLEYAEGLEHTPLLLQRARQGQYDFLNAKEQERLKKIIKDYSKDQEAFALLLVGYCHNNKMLNSVFGKLDDYTELLLPDDMLQDSGFLHLLNTTEAISDEEYKEVELIGWLYQFYISEKKDEVFASFKKRKKAEAKDIPAATQIFTPNWIVKYMVENTAGKIWLDKHPESPLRANMKYLVETSSPTGEVPKAEGLIDNLEELTLLDPAVGSGHILVEGFDLLYEMYMEEFYTPEEAVESILKNNLYGLDLDDRAVQLANFAILLKAATKYRDVFSKGWLPNVYAMPESKMFSTPEIKDFLGEEGEAYLEELETALALMQQAKNLGSVMKLNLSEEAYNYIQERYQSLLKEDYLDINLQSILQGLKSYIPILLILTRKYAAVVANPPYLGYKFLNNDIKQYIEIEYPNTKSDLFAVFQEVLGRLGQQRGKRGIINQWAWMCIDSYRKFREDFIREFHIESLLHLGIGVFKELNTKKVQSVALIYTNRDSIRKFSRCFKLDEFFDVNEKKRLFLNKKNEYLTNLKKLETIPGTPLAFWFNKYFAQLYDTEQILDNIITPRQGLATGKNDRFVRNWYEVDYTNLGQKIKNKKEALEANKKWFPYNKGGGYNKWYGNNYYVVNWENDGYEIKNNFNENGKLRSRPQNEKYYFKEGVTWSLISLNFSARYTEEGYLFDVGGSSGFPKKEDLYYAIALLNSKISSYILAGLNFTLNVQVGDIKRILYVDPKDDKKNRIESLSKTLISLSKKDFDLSELSRDFSEHILIKFKKENIKTSYINSKNEINKAVKNFYNSEKEINSAFIKLYNLEKELKPEPDLKYLTIYQDFINTIKLVDGDLSCNINKGYFATSFISYAIGVFMGRYRLDKPGLHIAHPNPTAEELTNYTYNSNKVTIDEDAILPLMGTQSNFPDDVLPRFYEFLDTIWGAEHRTENLNFVQECLDKDLERFLVRDFYRYHCRMYKKTPIYWLFASPKGAFQVLVYMHRMNAFTVEKIRANYLLEHIKKLRSEEAMLSSQDSSLSTAESRRLDQIRKDIKECEAYDMELKDVADAQITFDLDDGVKVNYAKFKTVVAKIR